MTDRAWDKAYAVLGQRQASAIWAAAYERSLATGDDHGWAANAGDCAVERAMTNARRVRQE